MLQNTPPYQMLKRAKMLSDSLAWYDAFQRSPNLKAEVVKMIQDDQLTKKGVDGNNEVIGYYSLLTEMISKGRKKFNTPFTLNDTGEFYRSMFVVVLSDSIIIGADTEKMEDQEWWKDEILSLNDENMRKLVDELRLRYLKYARKILFDRR